ncbi:hypothetical protein JCM3775_000967 [Rhodotorula graminis]
MPSGAAAALLAKALPKASGSGSSNGGGGGPAGRSPRSAARGKGVRGAGAAHMDEDVGMSDSSDAAAARRRGRQGRSGPMGERPNRNGRNAPGLLSDKPGRASSAPTSSKSGKGPDAPTQSTIDTLRLFLLSRYSNEAQLLNLENMAADPILKQHKLLAPGQPGAPTNMAPAMWKLSKELFPNIVSLSLANNDLTSLLPLSPWLLTSNLPNIENVSFAGNGIKAFRDMDPFSPLVGKERKDKQPKGWRNLKELVLTGNPVVASGGQPDTYAKEMARRFATLRTLDQQPIDPSIAFAVNQERPTFGAEGPGLSSKVKSEKAKATKREPVVFPVDSTAGGFCDPDGARGFVGEFLAKFFKAFDDDRPSLLSAYAPLCTFSFYADTANPVRARAKKVGAKGDRRFPSQHKLDWSTYLTPEGSRNLARVRSPEKLVATLKTTPSAVITSIVTLPKTQHPLEKGDKFVWDSWTMPGLLAPTQPGAPGEVVIFASVHGEFTEFPSKGVRSFDRNFILAPTPAGSPAAAAGWSCIIVSDVLTLRGYSDLAFSKPRVPRPPKQPSAPAATGVGVDPAVAAGGGAVPGAAGGAVPVVGQERAEGITDEQQSLVLQLQAVTRLTYTFAHMCLAQNGWDPHQALAQFQALHAQGSIPAEAFVPA